jgi:hypothetical protein
MNGDIISRHFRRTASIFTRLIWVTALMIGLGLICATYSYSFEKVCEGLVLW